MTLTVYDKLKILFRNREICSMTIEDLEIWEGFEKIFPGYLRFPETLEFNSQGFCNRTQRLRECKKRVNGINKVIDELLRSPEAYKGLKQIHAKRSKEIDLYLKKEKKRLDLHLKALRRIREKRYALEQSKETEEGK